MTRFLRGWFHLATGAAVGRVLGFASNLLLSRWLGPTDLGLFNLVTTTVQTSDTMVRCGGDYALNFELGGQPNATKTEVGVELARGLTQLCSLMTALICVVVFIWVWWGQGLFPSDLVAGHRPILTGLLLLMNACEGSSASAWEVLLVSHRTAPLALRQGFFFPLRLFFSSIGSLSAGVLGAMAGWTLIALVQVVWLRRVLGHLWMPFQLSPLLTEKLSLLLKRGLPFYAVNLISSIIFYPLLLEVAGISGLEQIGYLRVGQILQQLFAFLPATLVPILFLKLRKESSFANQSLAMERPLRVIWLLLLGVILFYCTVDQSLIVLFFGSGFAAALIPTRIMLITALFESLSQLIVQPLLAAGNIRVYGYWQNGSAVLAAVLGWLWIPSSGLAAFLIVRLLYVLIPLMAFGFSVVHEFHEPRKLLAPLLATLGLLALFMVQILNEYMFVLNPVFFAAAFFAIFVSQRQDLLLVRQTLSMRSK